jgi:hypothetical protein
VASTCERGNEPSVSVKCGEFLYYLTSESGVSHLWGKNVIKIMNFAIFVAKSDSILFGPKHVACF